MPAERTLEEIQIGDSASFQRKISEADVAAFTSLSGDGNPLHIDAEYARTTEFGERIVHGMFLGALCSQLVGMHLPGRRALYLSQSLSFRKPVHIGDTVIVHGKVESKSQSTGIIEIVITIDTHAGRVCEGVARVRVRSGYGS